MRTTYFCFPGGKHKALVLSYDDGRRADARLVALLNRYGVRGTFHLNYGLMEEEDRVPRGEVASLYAGHEVAAHTFGHPTIARCPIDHVAAQVIEDRRGLESLVGYPVRGMSYPNGSHSQAIRGLLPGLGIDYARVVGSSLGFDLPEDPYRWEATCHHSHDLLPLASRFLEARKRQYLYLMLVWGHSYEFDRDGNWGLIEEFCATVGGKDDIWYATAIEIVDCMRAWAGLRFAADGGFAMNPNAASAWIEVGGEVVEIPGGARIGLS